MTREEKISHLKDILSEINENDNAVCYLTSEDNELIESVIEALEQQPCEDCISREQAVDAVADLFEMSEYLHPYPQGKPIRLRNIKEKLKQLPPVQPKPIECEDAISRQDAINIVDFECGEWSGLAKTIVKAIGQLPPVQPKYNTDEWCHDCSEYNHDKHCCPRYTKVIRNTVEEMKQSCEDCISREQAIKQCGFGMTSLLIADNLRRLPPVHPKIKTGHWIKITPSGIYMCSECEQNVLTGDIDAYHYCHHCGIKMINVPDINDGKLHRSCTEVAQAQNNRKVSDKK